MSLLDKVIMIVTLFGLSLFGVRGILPMIPAHSIYTFCLAAVLIVMVHHLLQKKEQVLEVVEIKQPLSFGEIAIANNYLQEEQVAHILKLQEESRMR